MTDAFVSATSGEGPVERRPGDFHRSKQGTPYVTDPTGALIKPKRKADPPQIKRLAYGRPSGFGKQIEDTYNLAKWSERTVALGLANEPDLYIECATLVGRDRDTSEWRADADRIVIAAKTAAKGMVAADRGTHAHAITEEDDQERDWIVLAERGEILGLDVAVQASLVDAWRAMLVAEQLEVLATEASVVHDGYRMAGTLDRVARLGRDLTFTLATGATVQIPAGTVLVLDIKSGKRRVDTKGVVMYWQSYAVQIATYAGGQPYDTDTDQRGTWPWPISQEHALIAHLDVLGALNGQPSCELVYVDVAAGRHAAELCLAAKEWEKRVDVFSTIAAPVDAATVEQPAAGTDPPHQPVPAANSNPQPRVESRRKRLQGRCRGIAFLSAQAAAMMAATWPDVPPLTSDGLTDTDLDTIEAHIVHYETIVSAPFNDPQPLVETSWAATSRVDDLAPLPTSTPDDGINIMGGTAFDAMLERYRCLDEHAMALMTRTIGESMAAGRSIHMAREVTIRRCLIVDGLVYLAAAGLFTAARGLATTIFPIGWTVCEPSETP